MKFIARLQFSFSRTMKILHHTFSFIIIKLKLEGSSTFSIILIKLKFEGSYLMIPYLVN
jgi:hypothetical protein